MLIGKLPMNKGRRLSMPETCLGAAWRQKRCRSLLKVPYKFSDVGRTISIWLVRRVRKILQRSSPRRTTDKYVFFHQTTLSAIYLSWPIDFQFQFIQFHFILPLKGQEYRNTHKQCGEEAKKETIKLIAGY